MLSTASILAAPIEKEPMMLYIAATNRVISVVMVVERPEKDKARQIQRPVYYISEVLSASKQNYPHYKKMCYGVYMSAKRLKPYFQDHPITVVSSAPLADIIGSKEATGRVAKWAIEIAAHGIQYEPRTTIKSQALADFLVDWAETQYDPPPLGLDCWRMHFDGSKMKSGLGLAWCSLRQEEISCIMCSRFILQHPIMSPNMKPWFMVSSWQRKSASGTLSASATPISWCSNAQGLGMQKMQIWQATVFWCSS